MNTSEVKDKLNEILNRNFQEKERPGINVGFDKVYVLDTNIILEDANNLFHLSKNNLIVLPEVVIDELDSKKSGFGEINFQAREFGRILSCADNLGITEFNDLKILMLGLNKQEDGSYNTRIDIVQLNSKSLGNSISDNDKRIIEIAKKAEEFYGVLTLLSNDVMCRTRALMDGLTSTGLKGNVENINPEFIKFIKVDNVENLDGSCITDFDEEHSQINYCYHFKAKDGNQKIGYIIDNKINIIEDDDFDEMVVQPLNLGQRFACAGMLDPRVDIVVCEAKAGCCVAGTTVDVIYKKELDFNKDNLIKRFNLSNAEYKRCVSLGAIDKNNNIIKNHIIDFVKYCAKELKKTSSYTLMLKNDKKYRSKYLKLEYWLTFKSPAYSINKTLQMRKYKKFFENNEYCESVFKDYNIDNFQRTLMSIRSKLINSKCDELLPSILNNSCRTVDYWVSRGWTEIDALEKITKIQSKNSNSIKLKYTPEKIRYLKGKSTRIEYYLDQGYSEEESKLLLKERQTTFSLDKCIERYGEAEGTEIWRQRQIKWQNTLKSKPQEEIDDINRRKSCGIGRITDLNVPCRLYYMRFWNDDVEFWKIGLTTKTLFERFNLNTFKEKYSLDYEIIFNEELPTVHYAFSLEQRILEKFNDQRVKIEVNGFKSTECFNENVLAEFYYAN